MAMPRSICKLVKGKLLDAQRGFVETFNWLTNRCKDKVIT